jgi:hypothetical protein
MTFEYKTVGAPEKGIRKRGLRSQSDRVAYAFQKLLKAEATDGWEYLRTDLLPVTERSGWFGRGHEMHRAVMVFRRPINTAQPGPALFQSVESTPPQHRAPEFDPAPAPTQPITPKVSEDPDLLIAENVRGPGGPKPEG